MPILICQYSKFMFPGHGVQFAESHPILMADQLFACTPHPIHARGCQSLPRQVLVCPVGLRPSASCPCWHASHKGLRMSFFSHQCASLKLLKQSVDTTERNAVWDSIKQVAGRTRVHSVDSTACWLEVLTLGFLSRFMWYRCTGRGAVTTASSLLPKASRGISGAQAE